MNFNQSKELESFLLEADTVVYTSLSFLGGLFSNGLDVDLLLHLHLQTYLLQLYRLLNTSHHLLQQLVMDQPYLLLNTSHHLLLQRLLMNQPYLLFNTSHHLLLQRLLMNSTIPPLQHQPSPSPSAATDESTLVLPMCQQPPPSSESSPSITSTVSSTTTASYNTAPTDLEGMYRHYTFSYLL